MDIVCIKGSWDVILSEDADGNLEGVLVYHMRKHLGFRIILMPMQTPYNGIYILHKEEHKTSSRIAYENQVSEKLLSALPTHALYYQQYSPQIQNLLSHTWLEYKHTSRYTYLLDLTNKSEEELWNQLKAKARNTIRKAMKVSVIKEIDFSEFWDHCETSFVNKKQNNPYNKEVLSKLYSHYSLSGNCKIYACIGNEDSKIFGATFCISDNDTTYYMSGYHNPAYDDIGAMSYLLWYNITHTDSLTFDFEGSMIKPIEYFFRAFGGELTPHHKVWKVNNPILKLALKFKKLTFLDW